MIVYRYIIMDRLWNFSIFENNLLNFMIQIYDLTN